MDISSPSVPVYAVNTTSNFQKPASFITWSH